jgi:hypothetical protein
MKRRLLVVALIALSVPVMASAQATDVTPKAVQPSDLQQVTVGKLTYSVDPYNVFVCFPIATNQQWTGQGVTGNTTVQCFVRKGSTMTAIDPFLTDTNGVLEGVDLGTPLFSEVQP